MNDSPTNSSANDLVAITRIHGQYEPMAVIENSVQISRSPAEVFGYLADPRNELEWNPKVEVMEKITDGPVGLGTRFRAKWSKSKLVTMECTKYDPPNAWCYVNDGPVAVELNISLAAVDDGTRLTSRFEAHPKGAFRLIFPIFVMAMRREEARNMRLLKKAVEAQ
jgi:uncharacterized protein YndB with AHSA1/START domain